MTDENRKHQEECCKKSFWDSAKDTAARMAKDPGIAPDEVVKERMAICGQCDYWSGGKCDLCGCNLYVKTRFRSMRCPHDPPKWTECAN